MNTAPVTTALADNGVALVPVVIGGVTLPAGSTAAQRLEAHAKAGTQSQFHTDSTAMKLSSVDGKPVESGTKAPPSPAALERQNAMPSPEAQAAKIAAFDREQQAAGLQITPMSDEQRAEVIDLIKAKFVNVTGGNKNAASVKRFRGALERDLARIYAGENLTAAQITELRRAASGGNVESFLPKTKGTTQSAAQPAVSQHSPQAWAEAHLKVADEEGFVPFERINKAGLSGYTLPKFVSDQTYHASVFADLAAARAAGITQDQLNAFLRAEAVAKGYIK